MEIFFDGVIFTSAESEEIIDFLSEILSAIACHLVKKQIPL